jgi:membrane protein implicated in regulation of membrane protease activity
MAFNHRAASNAMAIFIVVCGAAALIAGVSAMFLYGAWPLGVFMLVLVAVPVVAGFWPTKEKGPG